MVRALVRRTLFFDLDGTLTDPREGIVGSLRYALDRLKRRAAADDDLTWCIGPPLIDSLETLLGDRASAELALVHYRERFSETGLYENRVYPGVPELLAGLKAAGHRLFIATSKPQVYADRIADHFGLSRFFERTFGPELDGTRGEKSALLAYALEETAAPAAASLMIGDRHHDVDAAQHHGLVSIAVLYGYGSQAELSAAGADHLVRTPEEIGHVVARLERPDP